MTSFLITAPMTTRDQIVSPCLLSCLRAARICKTNLGNRPSPPLLHLSALLCVVKWF